MLEDPSQAGTAWRLESIARSTHLAVITPLLALTLLAAGCIQAPGAEQDDATTHEPASAPPPEDRIDGMTAEEAHEDQVVPCEDNGDPLLPELRACAQRGLNVTGRIGVDVLPVELRGTSGFVNILPSEGDAWSLTAVYRVESMTEDLAMQALDTAWTWSHEDPTGEHAVRAGPTATEGAVITMGLSPTSRVTYSEFTLTLPTWVALDLKALTNNGQIVVQGYDLRSADLETDNGQIILEGAVGALRVATDNGGVKATITPREDAAWDLQTDNGQIVLDVPEAARYGYDIDATVDNGQVVIRLEDGRHTEGEGSVGFTTDGFESRAIQIKVAAQVDNGQIVIG